MLLSVPPLFADLFVGILGLILGSFVNVLVVRIPKGESIVHPPSHCRGPGCGARIRWWDNIPVLGYLLLLGKCRSCGQRISIRYPVIEIITAVLCLTALSRFGLSPLFFVRDIPFIVLLVATTFIDLEHRIIPNALSLGGLALGLATCWLDPRLGADVGALNALLRGFGGAALGFGVFYAFAWGYWRLTGRAGLGGGDIKLLAMLGAFLGPAGVFHTILISSVFGSLVGIAWALATRKKNVMTVAIPYGPFLVVGGLYYYLLGEILWLRFTIPT